MDLTEELRCLTIATELLARVEAGKNVQQSPLDTKTKALILATALAEVGKVRVMIRAQIEGQIQLGGRSAALDEALRKMDALSC